MQPLLFIFTFVILSFNVMGQTHFAGKVTNVSGEPQNEVVIYLVDNQDKQVDCTITDSLGSFSLQHITHGILVLSKLGFINKSIEIGANATDVEIILEADPQFSIKEVVITANSFATERIAGGISFKLRDPVLVKENSIWGALRLTPMLTVDEIQGISMTARSNVQVYINNRKSRMSLDALQQYLTTVH